MFEVPAHISPKLLFGATEILGAVPVTRLGAGKDASTLYYGADKKTSITHLVPQMSLSFGEDVNFTTYQKCRPKRQQVQLCSDVLFYRKFLTKQQPCGICERPLSVFDNNAILPCAHIVHVCCYEEKLLNRRKCTKCDDIRMDKRRFADEFIKFICCLYAYKEPIRNFQIVGVIFTLKSEHIKNFLDYEDRLVRKSNEAMQDFEPYTEMQLSSARSRLKRVYLNQRSKLTKTALIATIVLVSISPLLLNQKVRSTPRSRDDDNYVYEHSAVNQTPLIVVWTKYWDEDMLKMLKPTIENCDYKCELIDRTELSNRTASVYLFHGPNTVPSDLPAQGSDHLNVLIARESPLQLKGIKNLQQAEQSYFNNPLQSLFATEEIPRNYFNITISYKRSSRYFFPYGQLMPRSPEDSRDSIVTKEELRIALNKKKNGLLFYNCNTTSEKLYLESIRKLGATEITERDKCERRFLAGIRAGSALCKPDCSSNDLIATHRFYIAFEDDICDDFISEKFYDQFSQLLVPIVRKRRIYRDAGIPRHSFIAVDDFENFDDLGEYLEVLRRNDTEYLRYFEWTNDFRKPNTYQTDALCKLCEDIHNKRTTMVDDIENYLDIKQCE